MKRTIKRIDIDVMTRLMITLYKNGHEKKTNLARDANVNYDTCVHYLGYLEFIDFVKKIVEIKYEKFSLTNNGINFCKKILSTKMDPNNQVLV